jgi:uncharacterized protein
MNIFFEMLYASWDILLKSSIYMLFGFFVAGILYVFIKPEKINRYLGKGKIRPVFLSALAGIPLPLCSCGVVPAAAGLRKQGANKGATLAFLISTPETGVDSIPITYALMDPLMAVVRPLAAFVTSIVAGIAENFIGEKKTEETASFRRRLTEVEGGCGSESGLLSASGKALTMREKIMSGLKYAYVDLLADIGPWFIIGVLLAGVISYLIPDNFAELYLGSRFSSMLVMLVAGVPMYICATSSTPIAAALILKGLSPGAALVFLLSGPATNIASLSMVARFMGKRSLVIYLGSIAVFALLFGVLTDFIYMKLGMSAQAIVGRSTEIFPPALEFFAAGFLIILIVNAAWRKYKENPACSCSANRKVEPIRGI